jgi:hemoglobin
MHASKPTLLDQLGGAAGIADVAREFFAQMDVRQAAKGIRAMHGDELEPMVGKLAGFLTGWLGSPAGRSRASIIPLAHWSFAIGPSEIDEWLACMRAALATLDVEPDAAHDLMNRLEPVATLCRTDAEGGPF